MSLVNVIMVGDTCVGKSALLHRFIERKYNAFQQATIGTVYRRISVEVDGVDHGVEVWDTNGLKRSESVRLPLYPLADVINVVFSVADPKTFENVEKQWIPEIRGRCRNTLILLVGNMIDERNDARKNQITTEMGEKLAHEINAVKYIECSCWTGAGVSNLFQQSVRAAKRYRLVKEVLKNPKMLRKKIKKSKKLKTCSIITNHSSDVIDPPVVHYS